MAQIFMRHPPNGWSVLPLSGQAYCFREASSDRRETPAPSGSDHRRAAAPLHPARPDAFPEQGALLIRRPTSRDAAITSDPGDPTGAMSAASTMCEEAWAVIARPSDRVRLNGRSIGVGLAVLRHRDQLCFGDGASFFYSTEVLARVEIYRATDSPRCPRCTLPVEVGDACVRCPACHVVHHQREDRACFTYAEQCASCDQPSDLSAGFRFSPEGL